MSETNNHIDPDSSIVQVKIGNRYFDAVKNPRCKVCNHPARFTIEEMILLHEPYPKISRWISDIRNRRADGTIEDWYEIDAKKIRNHYVNGHCPLNTEMQKELAEERARELGIQIEESTGRFIDHIVVQKAVMARGYELLAMGTIDPDVKDMLAASKFLADREEKLADNTNIEQWQMFMSLYFQAVQKHVTPEIWDAIVAEISNHPVMREMQGRKAING